MKNIKSTKFVCFYYIIYRIIVTLKKSFPSYFFYRRFHSITDQTNTPLQRVTAAVPLCRSHEKVSTPFAPHPPPPPPIKWWFVKCIHTNVGNLLLHLTPLFRLNAYVFLLSSSCCWLTYPWAPFEVFAQTPHIPIRSNASAAQSTLRAPNQERKSNKTVKTFLARIRQHMDFR